MFNISDISKPVAGRYQLLNPIGNGNMSTVYEAQDTRRGRQKVAVKLLNTVHDDVLKEEIFRRETKALSQLEHPNIVTIFDYGWSDEYRCHYLVFAYVPRTLLDEIAAHAHDPNHDWCWPLLRHMADALVHAHSQGIIHRDIKPTNVLIDAAGQPKLVDFGVSLLKYELATGVTVSAFYSLGYASPEQRRGEPATEQSDIYSLGCVFYHMFARQAPPVEGFLTPEHINALTVHGPIKQILLRMLALDCHDRLADATLLRRRLEVTNNLELLPEVSLLVTDRARRDLFDQGHIDETSTRAACEFLLQELGGDNPKTVAISLDRMGLRLYTDTIRLLCVRDTVYPRLAITAIHVPYLPQLEQEKSHTLPFRALWSVVASEHQPSLSPSVRKVLSTTLDTLIQRLTDHQVEEQTQRLQRVERRDLTKVWEAVLAFQRDQMNTLAKLSYQNVIKASGDTLIFQLKQPVPDNLSWPDDAPVAVSSPTNQQTEWFVGHIVTLNGKTVQVSRNAGDTHQPTQTVERIPSSGLLGLYQQEAKVAIERQQAALSLIRNGLTVNPRLPDVLLNLSTATFDEIDPHIEFFQKNLAEDKQIAVRQALAANDLFLLQGPPGTGKTTTLAEIILQILKVKPDARILVASQSNVAVNHILSRLAELQGVHGIEIVRIGRAEKIGHGAQVWTIEQRLTSWREEVLRRTESVLADLKTRLRQKHREKRGQQPFTSTVLDDLQLCQTWLEEMAPTITELTTLSKRGWQEQAEDFSTKLALIRETLPVEVQEESASTLVAEWQRLTQIVSNLLSPPGTDNREQELLQLVTRWRKIFGKQEEFAQPLLERATILAATCLISGGRYLKDQRFDWAIIDEAGRATAPELIVSLARARRAILVGDEKQLPPMLDESLSNEALAQFGTTKDDLTESLFSSLVAQGKNTQLPAVQMLTTQHRMHPAIGQMVSTVFYNGKLAHAVDPTTRNHQLPWLQRCVVWYSTTQLERHGETQRGSSFYNRAEIQSIVHLLHQMQRTYQELGLHREVAVITPYNAQIVELVAEVIPDSSFWQALSIEISSIDAFQGRDRDIVLYSTVRSNATGQLGFLKDRRRLNVALSRAREALLIVGDIQTLEHGRSGSLGNPYQELIRYMRTHPQDCLIEQLELGETNG